MEDIIDITYDDGDFVLSSDDDDDDNDNINIIINEDTVQGKVSFKIEACNVDKFNDIIEKHFNVANNSANTMNIIVFVKDKTVKCIKLPNILYNSLYFIDEWFDRVIPTWITDESIGIDTKLWISKFNDAFMNTSVIHEDYARYFAFIEIAYIQTEKGESGVICWSAAYVVNRNGRLQVVDILTIRQEDYKNLTAIGDIEMFFKLPMDRIIIYAPNNKMIEKFYKSTLFPWSPLFWSLSNKFDNIITFYVFNNTKSNDLIPFCLDANRNVYGMPCSFCNLISSLVNIGCRENLCKIRLKQQYHGENFMKDTRPLHGDSTIYMKRQENYKIFVDGKYYADCCDTTIEKYDNNVNFVTQD